MTTQYETLRLEETYREAFGVEPPATPVERLLWPRKPAGFVVHQARWNAQPNPPENTPANTTALAQAEASPGTDEPAAPAPADRTRLLVPAQWGLVPHWVKSASDAKLRAPKLVTAKSDLVSTATAFRDAWLAGQRCIVPMQAFFADDYRKGGKPVPTRIARVDGKPMGVAGLWARWQGAEGEEIISYALITVNANAHGLMNRYQAPGSEKSMPAILNEGAYDAWLNARVEKAKEFLRLYPAQSLLANPVEKKADKAPKGWLD
jgi:putative SOS response-associated peptidase YedK